jgi:hypothetical protein
VECLEGVVEEGIGGVDFLGLVAGGLLVEVGEEVLEAADSSLLGLASTCEIGRASCRERV